MISFFHFWVFKKKEKKTDLFILRAEELSSLIKEAERDVEIYMEIRYAGVHLLFRTVIRRRQLFILPGDPRVMHIS